MSACLVPLLSIIFIVVTGLFFKEWKTAHWWTALMSVFALGSFITLLAFRQERVMLLAMTPYWRLPWRFFLSFCLLLCIVSAAQWLIAVVEIATIEKFLSKLSGSNGVSSGTGGRATDNFGGSVGILIAGFATVIGFVTKHIYGIAKDAEDQVKNIDENMQTAKTALLKVELHVAISILLEEWDMDEKIIERMRVKSIRKFLIESDHLFKDLVNTDLALNRLQGKVMMFNSAKTSDEEDGYVPDAAYSSFLRKKFAPFLEDLHYRLRGAPISEAPNGRACLDQVAELCRMFR